MAQNTTPVFVKAAAGDVQQVSTANANRDGTGTIATVATGTADGKRINVVRIKAIVTTTAGMVRFYYSADGGVTNRLIGEVVVSAITVGAGTAGFEADWIPPAGYLNLVGTSDMLRASTHNAETFNLYALGGSYAA
jgi:hypothetical protein